MIDAAARDELARRLQQLISGEITNDQFDEFYYERCVDSADSAVVEISTFGWGLYSSDTLLPYRLKGRQAICGQRRQQADRAIRFLQSDREYEWPASVACPVPFFWFWGPAFYLLIGVVLLLAGVLQRNIAGLFEGLLGAAMKNLKNCCSFFWRSSEAAITIDLQSDSDLTP